jgi:hypothetical protein
MPLVPLLPNTGVQYAFLPGLFTDDALKSAVARLNFEVGFGLGGRIRAVDGAAADARRDDEEESPFEDDPAEKSGDRYAVRADPERVVDMILADGGWLPVPFDAVSPLFTMLWLGRNERKWDAVLAVDTTVSDSLNSDSLTAECVPGTYRIEPVKSALFWKNKAVVGWLDRHHRRMFGGRAAAARPEESLGGLQAHLAGFYSFLASLKDFPQVTFSALNQAPVNANLVVDLGNSRTCCVLQETNADGEPRWSRLELRNPAKPLQAETRPVDSRLAFMPPVHEVLDGASTFRTLSLIRLGQAAMDVIGESNEDVGVRGMSSPKRYMWDSDRRPQPWQFARSPRRAEASAGAADSHPISGVLLKHIEVKTPFDALKRPVDGGYPDYSRKTIALFVFLELLEQAYRQVNSVEHRGATSHLPGATRRRVLRNLVILHPAGMHTDELTEFRRAAQRAASLFAAFHTNAASSPMGAARPRRTRSPTSTWRATRDSRFRCAGSTACPSSASWAGQAISSACSGASAATSRRCASRRWTLAAARRTSPSRTTGRRPGTWARSSR